MEMEKDGNRNGTKRSAASGVVAIIFLIIGYQAAIFVQRVLDSPPAVEEARATEETPVAVETHAAESRPDRDGAASDSKERRITEMAEGAQRRQGVRMREKRPGNRNIHNKPKASRKVETFRFDPNTVSVEDLVRLGLSQKQAESIARYREKGGRFRKREDFSRMYVVSDSLYRRVCDSIDIPKLDLNSADSAALTTLRGIGPWYASAIIRRREALGGFVSPWQLLEIRGIDSSRIEGFIEAVTADTSLVVKIDLTATEEERLASHPYIGKYAARCIARYREVTRCDSLPISVLKEENILDDEMSEKLKPYLRQF